MGLFFFNSLALLLFPLVAIADANCHRFYQDLLATKRLPLKYTENLSGQVIDSAYTFHQQFPTKWVDNLPVPIQKKGNTVFVNTSLPKVWITKKGREIPLEVFYSLHGTVESSLTNQLQLSAGAAQELAFRAQKALVESMGESWKEYSSFLKSHGVSIAIDNNRLLAAMHEIPQRVIVEKSFDIPFLAGYTPAGVKPKKLFIDRGFPNSFIAASGKNVDLLPPLLVHEGVETALIDELLTNPITRTYYRTHQIAQQLEKQCVEALGMNWNEYQHIHMQREIARAGKDLPNRTPKDLDLTPYIDDGNQALLQRMKEVAE